MRASGKTVAVTGGGNGIGRELVLQLLGRGARVAALDISEKGLAETAELADSAKDRLSTHAVNIADREAVGALPAAIVAAHGQVDGLINCAGIIQPFVRFNDLEYDAIERIMNVNLWGTIHTIKAFLPVLLQRPEAHIVNISSMGGLVPVPGQTMYGATKAAVMLLTEGLHSELVDTSVAVTVVFPGAIHTDISKNSGVGGPGGAEADASASKIRMTEPDAAARMILDGMEKNAYRVMVGSDVKMMDRLSRLSPLRAATIIYQQMRELLPS
ncbi:MAG: short-chain dehydrogenase [Actinobacteria bacterium HGW-Actinobacteria-7]|jgi:short-subunit dehydrogenase|nr:MAG: short-chain dehydrogenase [Actinobacteria bacterium HGW-Actinobacteria-7]